MHFFGKSMGFDPFNFLDGAPAIKPPLDLGDTDSDEEASETASSVTIGSVSTTASLATDAEASTSTAPAPAPRPVPKVKPVLPDKVPGVEYAEGCIPTSLSDIHHTGIPNGVACKRSGRPEHVAQASISAPMQIVGRPPMWEIYMGAAHIFEGFTMAPLLCAPTAPTRSITVPADGKNTCLQNTLLHPGLVPRRLRRPP